MFKSEYTDEQLIEHAKQFETRAAWRNAGRQERLKGHQSHWGSAIKRGRTFMRKCCAHMVSGMVGNTNRRKYSEEDLISTAKLYQHRGDWKRSANAEHRAAYQAAIRRSEVFTRATAHMTPKAHPYSGAYTIYVYEFADKHAYVGLTFLPVTRHLQHMQRGPVRDHIVICQQYLLRSLEQGISDPKTATERERYWLERYRTGDWILLNDRPGGGLGTVQVTKWTKEAVMAEALKYQTKQEWIDKSQMSYRIAKREGWFDAASAHMPKRVLGIGAGVPKSAAAKKKMRQAKLGKPQSAAAKAAKSEAIRKWWAARKAGPAV